MFTSSAGRGGGWFCEELAENDVGVDSIAMDEKKAYRRKMGQWRRATLNTLQDPLFDFVVRVMHARRKPFIHLSNFLKKKLKPGEPGHLFQLVVGKAASLAAEFDHMLFGGLSADE